MFQPIFMVLHSNISIPFWGSIVKSAITIIKSLKKQAKMCVLMFSHGQDKDTTWWRLQNLINKGLGNE